MHDTERVAGLNNPNNDPRELGRLPFAIMPPLNNPIKQLPTGAELHHDMHIEWILIRALDGHHIAMPGQMVHDLDLPPDIVEVLFGDELPLGDGLAGVTNIGGDLRAEVRGAELALP